MPLLLPYSHSVRVERLATTRDSAGGNVAGYTTRAAGVPCDIGSQSGSQDERFDAKPRIVRHTVWTGYAGIEPGDRLYVESGPPKTAGKYLTVVAPVAHPGGFLLPARSGWECEQVLEG